MGCDIHTLAEVRNKKTGKWEIVKGTFTSDYHPASQKKSDHPFDWRNYSIFAFLANVRNYDHSQCLSEPKGLPKDSEYLNKIIDEDSGYGGKITKRADLMDRGYHSFSFLTLKELLDFDYEKTFENRRITKMEAPNFINGRALAEEGEGKIISYRENLGKMFFIHLEELKSLGSPEDVRVVFWFDC